MEVIKCKLFLITKPTKKHSYFFLFILGSFLRVLIPDLLKKYLEKKGQIVFSNTDLKFRLTQKYFELIRNIGSDLLFGIFYFIHKIRNKDEPKKNSQRTYQSNNQKIYFIFNDESSRIPTTYKIILIISIVDIICQLLIPIYFILEDRFFSSKKVEIEPNQLYYLLFFDIFARYLFSRWILKTFFYLHHYLSFILSLIGLICITIIDIMTKTEKNINFLIFVIISSVQLILYSFEDIMNKVAFRTLYILPNTLIFFKGLFQIIYFGIISAFLFGFGFYSEYKHIYRIETENFVCFVLFNILRTYYLVKVIDKFSAQHMTILRVLECIVLFVYQLIQEKHNGLETWQLALQIIGFSFLTIASLIHNELIIINHPKLKAKTEYYLDKDADKEQYSSFCSDTLFTESKDSSNSVTNLYSDLTGSDMS